MDIVGNENTFIICLKLMSIFYFDSFAFINNNNNTFTLSDDIKIKIFHVKYEMPFCIQRENSNPNEQREIYTSLVEVCIFTHSVVNNKTHVERKRKSTYQAHCLEFVLPIKLDVAHFTKCSSQFAVRSADGIRISDVTEQL
ncbi:hypothetical protein T07_852 [Trichinella nelsoni]|uniref:Uncharacterized protein n=1 Tax=Trichinella nelsoni TaxID=6336 RepID=A0A0V0RVC0_9BILA|nr:hypothetical protein T07_852 [Trichinella nelsoni]